MAVAPLRRKVGFPPALLILQGLLLVAVLPAGGASGGPGSRAPVAASLAAPLATPAAVASPPSPALPRNPPATSPRVPPATAAGFAAPFVPGEVLVKFKARAPGAVRAEALGRYNAERRHVFHSGAEHWRLPAGE